MQCLGVGIGRHLRSHSGDDEEMMYALGMIREIEKVLSPGFQSEIDPSLPPGARLHQLESIYD